MTIIIVSATRRRKDIKIMLCLLAPMHERPWLTHKCDVSAFDLEIPFLRKFGQKNNQNYQFKLKFGIYINSSMQNLIVVFILFVSD